MKKIKISLYSKLLILAGSLELILIIAMLFGFSTSRVLNDRDKMRNVQTVILTATQNRMEFTRRRDTTFSKNFADNMYKFDSILNPYLADSRISRILMIKNNYENEFNRYVELMKTRGLNENLGLEGKFRNSIHAIEHLVQGTGHDKIMIYMLQSRRSEKDFINRLDTIYIPKVEHAIDTLSFYASTMNSSPELKSDILRFAQNYLDNFHNLAKAFQDLRTNENRLEMYEDQINSGLKPIVSDKAGQADMIQTIQIVVASLSLLVGILLSIFLARSITKPVKLLSDAVYKISQGELDSKVEVHSSDEIGELSTTFNFMTESLKKSAETIKDQQDELKNQNIKLESLNVELKSSFNNLAVLSNIGQSLTATLNFDDLMSKLYQHLTFLVDSSVFGIGLVSKDGESLVYGMIIKQSEQFPGIKVDMNVENRADVLAVKYAQEILIDDMDDYLLHIKGDYPWIEDEKPIGLDSGSMALIYIPIKMENKVIGVISIENKKKLAYKLHDLDTLRNLASYISIALINAQSYNEITRSHEELKKTQTQLIQAEKMASLGQLTTGIAHEIKNPLNFINNYSGGTIDLCKEFLDEFQKFSDKFSENDYNYLAGTVNEIMGYLETIINNGKRIDRIVKSMMEHARGGSGEKTETNLNSLVREFVKLAYNGYRAQYKSYNANFRYFLDESDPVVDIRQGDISRVITNLIDNGCYSTAVKKELSSGEFFPEIEIHTLDRENYVELKIKDNGAGIPKKITDKIFNPFFTTKPTGEGTGLGLSLSYDIITNGHNGKMTFNTVEGEFAEFIIQFPKKPNLN